MSYPESASAPQESAPTEPAQGRSLQDSRNESAVEKLDRNWMELLQELRVLQTGVQILAGFLLTLPFQSRFETLDDFQTNLYLANVALAALTTALILLPVSVHRRLFRLHLRAALVSSADRIAKVSLAGIGLLSVGTTALVFDVTAGRAAGLTAGAVLLAVLLILLVYVPSRLRRQAEKEN
ncbi:glucan phosphoethanolaminetransferase (alkaline phosphatase superfamily) [Pseudarthrobacter oxydans]|nr:glucan phosphoethanolaminetransferase (alkaline phosphatase superfamily) [Pseudarthrobacter oxydans]